MPEARLDAVLINPGGRRVTYQSLASNLTAVEPPVWTGLIATYLRQHGLTVAIIDANAEELSPARVAERVDALAPRFAAVIVYGHQPSASTQSMPAAAAICTALKDACVDLRVGLVGGHVASLPERTLREEDVDFVCTGEGPVALLELALALRDGGDLSQARGIAYWNDGALSRTEPAPLVQDPEQSMPAIAWDLLPMDRYRAHNWHCFGHISREPYAAIYTSLGCPYKCSFCCIQAPFKEGERQAGRPSQVNTYRMWSADSVLAQIDTLVQRYGVRNIKIADEMFVLNERHVNEICSALRERDYGLNLWAYGRVDTITPERAAALKSAGFNWIALGIEAARAHVRNGVDKSYAQDDIYRAVSTLHDAGIHVIGNYIFGLPEDDLASMEATLTLALELNCAFANFYTTMAYPGSRLYDEAIANNWDLPPSWSGYSQHSIDTLPLATRHLSAREVLQFRDAAFDVYFTNPRYLDMIAKTFGNDARDDIASMTHHKLERAIA